MKSWDALGDLFAAITDNDPLQLSYSDIEEIIDASLPDAASTISWWRAGHEHAVWAEHGWFAQPRPSAREVTFRKIGAGRSAVRSPIQAPLRRDARVLGTPSSEFQWDAYDAWNDSIAVHFFDGSFAQRPVYLDMDDGTLAGMAAIVGADGSPDQELTDAVAETLLIGITGMTTFARHINRKRKWESNDRDSKPPFLALLAFFSLIAEQMHQGDGFAADNYYGRLADAVGFSKADVTARNRLFSHFRDQSHELWDALNDWLERNDGHLGVPTARVFDWRVHVGIPISQALMKQADRDRLPDLFAKWGLQPGQEMAPRDMVRVLDAWLPSSNLSPYVRSLWKPKSEAKLRIAEVVCVELSTWDGQGSDPETSARRVTPLLLGVRTRSFPTRRIDISLTAQAGGPLAPGRYRQTEDSDLAAIALGGKDSGLVVPESRDAWVHIEGTGGSAISIPDVLAISIQLEHEAGSRLARHPRAVVVLTSRDDSALRVEAQRVELGKSETLLVHDGAIEDVITILSEHARPGFTVTSSSELIGLPNGWSYIEQVELASVPETADPKLGPLVPVAWTALSMHGGLQLPGRATWHVSSPPYVAVSAIDLDSASIAVREDWSDDSSTTAYGLNGVDYLDLDQLELADGDFTLELRKSAGSRSPLMTRRFRLRSASTVAQGPRSDAISIGRSTENRAWVITGSEGHDPIEFNIRGARLEGLIEPNVAPGANRELPATLTTTDVGDWHNDDGWGPAPSPAARTASIGCISGAHYWIIESAGRTLSPQRDMAAGCRNCGLTKWFPARPKKKKIGPLAGAAQDAVQNNGTSNVAPVRQQEATEVDHDLLLDALSYSQGGTWASFVKLASQLSDSPWFARETARDLSALGHIDLELDPVSLSPIKWAIAPATITSLPDTAGAVLCGFRSEFLIETISAIASELGGRLATEDQPNGPRRISIHGLDDDLKGVAEVISEDADLDCGFSERAAGMIAGQLPHLSDVVAACSRFSAPVNTPAEAYVASTNKWLSTEIVHAPGAYRFQTRPVVYGSLVGVKGGLVRGDNRWSKWFGGLAADQNMLAYSPEHQMLITRLGAQLPGMYERAAVLASGYLPKRYDDGTVRYRAVSEHLAKTIGITLTERPT